MQERNRKILSAFLAFLMLASLSLLLICSISGNEMPFTGQAAEYCEELMEQGFPEDYAISLTKIHLLHPTWTFVPLNITQANADYTWNYVIGKETESPTINLVSKNDAYKDYWHAINRTVYDAGYYQPSKDAVEYFMDPRNFLNEADIFQFYDLSNGQINSEEAVDAVLADSFMACRTLQNGKTYTEYLMEIGEEIGIDPVYLAVKLRQEQGANGTSPIISGSCGDKLWEFYRDQKQFTDSGSPVNPPQLGAYTESELKSLNGLYNPFNINATGDGVFAIYQNAMLYAQNGSSSMAESWGGSSAWNTDWKGIYGGALFIKEKYIERYQSTIYLQKFDVDSRNPNGNFKNQYMQNLFGALSEARSFYRAFASNDTLDTDCRFLIPVYKKIPSKVCADPANGNCPTFAPASSNYETTALITVPNRFRAANDAIYGEISVAAGDALTLSGEFTHSYGIKRLEYSFDGLHWTTCSDSGILGLNLNENLPDYGEHLLLIRGEAAYDVNNSDRRLNRYFLCAAFHLTMLPPPSVTLTLQSGNAISDEKKYYVGDQILLPTSDAPNFAGWIGSDGTMLPSGGTLTMLNNVKYTALFVDLRVLEGAALSLTSQIPHLRFSAVIPYEQMQLLGEHVALSATLSQNGNLTETTVLSAPSVTGHSGTLWQRFAVNTHPLSQNEYSDKFEACFFLHLTYSDGTSKTISASGESIAKSPVQIAESALGDKEFAYSSPVIEYLQSILPDSE